MVHQRKHLPTMENGDRIAPMGPWSTYAHPFLVFSARTETLFYSRIRKVYSFVRVTQPCHPSQTADTHTQLLDYRGLEKVTQGWIDIDCLLLFRLQRRGEEERPWRALFTPYTAC